AGGRFDALDEGMLVVHVEDQDAGPAKFEVVADAGSSDVEEVALALVRVRGRYAGSRPQEGGPCEEECSRQPVHALTSCRERVPTSRHRSGLGIPYDPTPPPVPSPRIGEREIRFGEGGQEVFPSSERRGGKSCDGGSRRLETDAGDL